MKILKSIIKKLSLSIVLVSSIAMADSPLTSTKFTAAYPEYEIIQKTVEAKDKLLTNEQAAFLASEEIPVGARAALVNALSWHVDGQYNAALFTNYLESQDVSIEITKSAKDILSENSANIVALYTYLLAMDNYMDVAGVEVWADRALEKNQKSMTIHMIKALVEAQEAMDGGDWCKVYQLVDNVRNNKELEQDFKAEAINSIFEYINLYKNECK